MNINIKFIIIGLVVFLILVATHRNPADERKKAEEAERALHPDALVYSIEQHNKNGFGRGGVGALSGTSGNPPTPGTAGGQNSQYQNPAMQKYYNNYNYPGGTNKNPNAYNDQYYGQAPQNNNQQQNNSYYPPPPVSGNGSIPAPPPPLAPRTMNATTTDDGQRVAFGGTSVYQVDGNGKWKPMPDGNYKMANGANLVVRGGKKIIITN